MLSCLPGFNSRRTPHQIIMFGLEGAGKTTLLYRLKVPGWTELRRDMQKAKEKESHWDCGYHYEEFRNGRLGMYGMWDVPGSDDMIPLWHLFYRYVTVSAIIFVVDASPEEAENVENIQKARRWLFFLLNEDEIRNAAFIVIVNERWSADDFKTKKQSKSKRSAETDTGNVGGGLLTKGRDPTKPWTMTGASLQLKLNVAEIQEQPWNKDRFRVFFLDCSDPSNEWRHVIEEIYKIHIKKGNEGK